MTVKCINYIDKQAILGYFRAKIYNQRQLANLYKTSERTIYRVLVEAGIATAVPRIKGEAYTAMQILKEFDLPVSELRNMLVIAQLYLLKQTEAYANERSIMELEYEDVPF